MALQSLVKKVASVRLKR